MQLYDWRVKNSFVRWSVQELLRTVGVSRTSISDISIENVEISKKEMGCEMQQ